MSADPARRYIVESISCGRDHTLALTAGGKVLGWGGDGSGRMPAGTPEYCSTLQPAVRPVEVGTRHAMTSIAAGHGISLGISVTKQTLVWGGSPAITAGRRPPDSLVEPRRLPEIASARAIAAGEFLFGAINTDGAIHTWGLNNDGALGRPTPHLNAAPGTIASLAASQLSVGKGYMLALTDDGAIHAWGSNAAGQLGLGTLASAQAPQRVRLEMKARAIAAGATHALAVASEGAVYAWGSNHRGQLGRKAPAYSTVPLKVDLPERVRFVAAGMHFSLALGISGHVYAWGWNGHGQLGVGDTADRYAALLVPGLDDASAIAAGETHAAALTSDGLRGWGNNAAGQIGPAERRQTRPFLVWPS
jgi:alpha-tubulin suppressor-like RCC1 family protein